MFRVARKRERKSRGVRSESERESWRVEGRSASEKRVNFEENEKSAVLLTPLLFPFQSEFIV